MGGPVTYIRAIDRTHEFEIERRIEAAWDCKVTHYGDTAYVDMRLSRDGHTFAVAEAKAHSAGFCQYGPGFVISETKVAHVRALAARLDVPGYIWGLFVGDGSLWWTRADLAVVVYRKWGGRGGRREREWMDWLSWATWHPENERD
jgi:hypothetical protein